MLIHILCCQWEGNMRTETRAREKHALFKRECIRKKIYVTDWGSKIIDTLPPNYSGSFKSLHSIQIMYKLTCGGKKHRKEKRKALRKFTVLKENPEIRATCLHKISRTLNTSIRSTGFSASGFWLQLFCSISINVSFSLPGISFHLYQMQFIPQPKCIFSRSLK